MQVRNAFCAIRPPGHHAGPTGVVACANDPIGSHGFCLLNNIAIAAAYAMNAHRHAGKALHHTFLCLHACSCSREAQVRPKLLLIQRLTGVLFLFLSACVPAKAMETKDSISVCPKLRWLIRPFVLLCSCNLSSPLSYFAIVIYQQAESGDLVSRVLATYKQ